MTLLQSSQRRRIALWLAVMLAVQYVFPLVAR